MSKLKQILIFLTQSVVVGLAAAFLVVLLRPELLPAIDLAGSKATPASFADAIDLSAPAVASVYTRKLQRLSDSPENAEIGRSQLSTSIGSAVVIDAEGYLVTNFHVVAGATEIRVQMADGRITNPQVVGYDAETDLAVLKIDADRLMPIHWGDSDRCKVGSPVWAVGSPFGLDRTVTFGIVSGR